DRLYKPLYYSNSIRFDMYDNGYVAAITGHSRCDTVDLTLYHLASCELARMGGDYDLMDVVSHHGARGIARTEAQNRHALRLIMEASGSSPYEYEWWHYTLKDEPYPDTYFDFPIA